MKRRKVKTLHHRNGVGIKAHLNSASFTSGILGKA
jgi:hypothetical protein